MLKLPKLPTLQPRERLLAAGAVAILLLVVLDRLVLEPWSRHAVKIRAEIRQMEAALVSHERLLSRRTRVMADLQRHQRYFRDAIADDLQMAALLKEAQELAEQAHVKVAEIKPLATESTEFAKRYSLEVRFAGALDDWVDFLYHLETSPSLYEVVRAGLSTKEETPDRLDAYLRLTSVTALPEAGSQEEPTPHATPTAS